MQNALHMPLEWVLRLFTTQLHPQRKRSRVNPEPSFNNPCTWQVFLSPDQSYLEYNCNHIFSHSLPAPACVYDYWRCHADAGGVPEFCCSGLFVVFNLPSLSWALGSIWKRCAGCSTPSFHWSLYVFCHLYLVARKLCTKGVSASLQLDGTSESSFRTNYRSPATLFFPFYVMQPVAEQFPLRQMIAKKLKTIEMRPWISLFHFSRPTSLVGFNGPHHQGVLVRLRFLLKIISNQTWS
jgi:hypothetical protein